MQAINGGKDPGAVNGTRKESNDVLRLALAVQPLLIAAGHEVIMSRTTDSYTSVTDIAKAANASKADYFVALHRNAATSTATGNEVLISSTASSASKKMAQAIQTRICKVVGRDRGVKVQDTRTHVLQATTMPACTVELGFISSSSDNALFDSKFGEYAKAITDGICEVAGKSVETTPKSPTEGWNNITGQWYYDDGGKPVTGWKYLAYKGSTNWYYFDAKGVMQASKWVNDKGNDYYLTKSGAMATYAYILSAYGTKVYWFDGEGVWDMKTHQLAV